MCRISETCNCECQSKCDKSPVVLNSQGELVYKIRSNNLFIGFQKLLFYVSGSMWCHVAAISSRVSGVYGRQELERLWPGDRIERCCAELRPFYQRVNLFPSTPLGRDAFNVDFMPLLLVTKAWMMERVSRKTIVIVYIPCLCYTYLPSFFSM